MRPATLHDFPLPVFPKTARCRPKSLSGSTLIAASAASGDAPIRTRFSESFPPTIASICSGVGIRTWSPTEGKALNPPGFPMLEVWALYDKLNGKVCETQGRSLLVRAVGVEPTRLGSRSKRFERPILRFVVGCHQRTLPKSDMSHVRRLIPQRTEKRQEQSLASRRTADIPSLLSVPGLVDDTINSIILESWNPKPPSSLLPP
jgi:hypothetical protein